MEKQPLAKILQFRKKEEGRTMNTEPEEKHTTSLTLPKSLFLMLKQDADRCHRSMAGQVAAILSVIYMKQDVAIHGTERYAPAIEIPEQKVKAA